MYQLKSAIAVLFFATVSTFAQGLERIPFLEMGSKPVEHRQWLVNGTSSASYYTGSDSFEKQVKADIATQKDAGFKKVDKATFLLANTRALQSTYPVEAGYIYRIILHCANGESTSILRVKDSNDNELSPEVRTNGKGSAYSFEPTKLQMADFTISQNGTITLEQGMMGDRTIYYANVYLIFRKKV